MHNDYSNAEAFARKTLGYGVTAVAAYALHQMGCSAEDILKILAAFHDDNEKNRWGDPG